MNSYSKRGSDIPKSNAYLTALTFGFIIFFAVKLLSGIVKYLRNRN